MLVNACDRGWNGGEDVDVLKGAALAFSSFSKIPMPQVEWDERNMRYMMCFFPVVGVAIGLVLAAWVWLSQALGFGQVLFGAGVALVPVAVSGGIHLDGFCDVVDALSSHASPERKRTILKDPHTGAFASIGVAAYLLAYAALASELPATWQVAALLAGLHVASRCLSGFATTVFSTSESRGMLSMFHDSTAGPRVPAILVAEFVACGVFVAFAHAAAGIAMMIIGLVLLVGLHPFAKRNFGGMSGDVAGFFLQVCELAMLAVLVIVAKAVGL